MPSNPPTRADVAGILRDNPDNQEEAVRTWLEADWPGNTTMHDKIVSDLNSYGEWNAEAES